MYLLNQNKFRDVQNLHHDKASKDMTLNEYKLLIFTCWNEKYQLPTIDMTNDKYNGCYRLRLHSVFVPHRSLVSSKWERKTLFEWFITQYNSIYPNVTKKNRIEKFQLPEQKKSKSNKVWN